MKARLVFQSSPNHLLILIKYVQGHWRSKCHTLRRLLSSVMYISNEPWLPFIKISILMTPFGSPCVQCPENTWPNVWPNASVVWSNVWSNVCSKRLEQTFGVVFLVPGVLYETTTHYAFCRIATRKLYIGIGVSAMKRYGRWYRRCVAQQLTLYRRNK